jgi:hypothetical protein
VHSKGSGKIKFTRYADYSGCGDTCDFYFKPLEIQDGDGKVLESIAQTTPTSNTNYVDLKKVDELKDPIEIIVPTNKTVKIVTTVWDKDGGAYGDDDKIRDITDFNVPFNKRSPGDNWEQLTKTIGREMQFTLDYKLTQCHDNFTGLGCNSCEENYYTEQCNVNCVPVSGNYTCNQNTGDKICQEGKTGDNCDECMNGKVGENCDQCKNNFTGTNCDICADNYYPKDSCDVLCEPNPEKYTCTDQGRKQCLGNREGENCEACKPDYYKEDCSEFCKENEYYNCTSDGRKVCQNKTADPEKNCGRPDEDEKKDREEAERKHRETEKRTPDNTVLIGAAGAGGGLLLILAGTVLALVIRKRRREHGQNTSRGGEDEDKPGEMYATINKPPPGSRTKEQPRSDDQDLYSRLNRPPGSRDPRGANTTQHVSGDPAEEGETYADVVFVKNRERGPVAVYRNTGVEEEGGESTYIAVTELI